MLIVTARSAVRAQITPVQAPPRLPFLPGLRQWAVTNSSVVGPSVALLRKAYQRSGRAWTPTSRPRSVRALGLVRVQAQASQTAPLKVLQPGSAGLAARPASVEERAPVPGLTRHSV